MVGVSRKVFTIHSAVLEPLSRYFVVLINGPFLEAQEGIVEWPDIEEETFIAFSQFAYDGDYMPPDTFRPYTIAAGPTRGNHVAQRAEYASCGISRCSLINWHYAASTSRSEDEARRQSPHWPIREKFMDMTRQLRTSSTKEVFAEPEALLSHAKMYVLGDRYDMPNLRKLALDKLAFILSHMILSYRAADHVAQFVEYVYKNTRTLQNFPNHDGLRRLLVTFSACVYDQFLINVQFSQAVRAHGEFSLGVLELLQASTP